MRVIPFFTFKRKGTEKCQQDLSLSHFLFYSVKSRPHQMKNTSLNLKSRLSDWITLTTLTIQVANTPSSPTTWALTWVLTTNFQSTLKSSTTSGDNVQVFSWVATKRPAFSSMCSNSDSWWTFGQRGTLLTILSWETSWLSKIASAGQFKASQMWQGRSCTSNLTTLTANWGYSVCCSHWRPLIHRHQFSKLLQRITSANGRTTLSTNRSSIGIHLAREAQMFSTKDRTANRMKISRGMMHDGHKRLSICRGSNFWQLKSSYRN